MAQVEPEVQGSPTNAAPAPGSNPPVLARDHGQDGHARQNGNGVNMDDPRTQILLEQILNTLAQESAPPEEKTTPSYGLALIATVARRRWRPMLFVLMVSAALVLYRLKPDKPQYVATSTMILPSANGTSSSSISATDLVAIVTGTRNGLGGQVDTQIAIVKGPSLIARAMAKLSPALRQRGWGDPKASWAPVDARAPVSTDLIDISVTAGDPVAAMALANSLIDAFAERSKEEGNRTFDKNLAFLKKTVDKVGDDLNRAKRELQAYKEQHHIFTIETNLNTSTAHVQELSNATQAADAEVAAGPTGTAVLSDATTTSLQQKATEAESRYQTVMRDYLPQAPEAQKAKEEADSARALYEQRVKVMMNTARSRAQALHVQLARAQSEASALPGLEYKLTELMGKVELLGKTYQTLSTNYTNMMLQRQADVATAHALTPATNAVEAARTWTQAGITALLCALVLASLAAFLLEQVDNTLHAVDDLEPMLPHTNMLGAMPLQRKQSERRLMPASGRSATPVLLESCRIIRSNLAFATLETPARSILVTSADPGEGKSLCALNLATVMAFDGRRVILVDCDLRRPAQHVLNQVTLEPGVSNVLSGDVKWEDAVVTTNIPGLSVMPAGTLPPNPPELLGSGANRQLVQDLKENYDMVILDSPPALSLTDAQVLCSIADGVVMVVAADSTTRPHVKRAYAKLRHAGGRVLGVILNKIRESSNPDLYNTYYTYHGDGRQLENGAKGLLTRGR